MAGKLETSSEEVASEEKREMPMEEQLLFKSRQVLIFGEIDDAQARAVCRRLLALDAQSHDPVTIFVSSPGGHVESGDAIHDMIRFVSSPVTMVGTGWVGSAAAHIFLAGEKARRLCLPNTRFLIHQPAGGAGGQATDIAIQAEQIIKMRERLARVIAERTGQPIERVAKDIERDYWMDTEQAMEYGLISRVIESAGEL